MARSRICSGRQSLAPAMISGRPRRRIKQHEKERGCGYSSIQAKGYFFQAHNGNHHIYEGEDCRNYAKTEQPASPGSSVELHIAVLVNQFQAADHRIGHLFDKRRFRYVGAAFHFNDCALLAVELGLGRKGRGIFAALFRCNSGHRFGTFLCARLYRLASSFFGVRTVYNVHAPVQRSLKRDSGGKSQHHGQGGNDDSQDNSRHQHTEILFPKNLVQAENGKRSTEEKGHNCDIKVDGKRSGQRGHKEKKISVKAFVLSFQKTD